MELYWQAYLDLTTERPMTMGGAGRIPWSKVMEWGDRHDIADMDRLWYLVSALDRCAAEHHAKAAAPKAAAKPAGAPAVRPPRKRG